MASQFFGFCERLGCPPELEDAIVLVIFWYIVYLTGKMLISFIRTLWPFVIGVCLVSSYYYPNMRDFLEATIKNFALRFFRGLTAALN